MFFLVLVITLKLLNFSERLFQIALNASKKKKKKTRTEDSTRGDSKGNLKKDSRKLFAPKKLAQLMTALVT